MIWWEKSCHYRSRHVCDISDGRQSPQLPCPAYLKEIKESSFTDRSDMRVLVSAGVQINCLVWGVAGWCKSSACACVITLLGMQWECTCRSWNSIRDRQLRLRTLVCVCGCVLIRTYWECKSSQQSARWNNKVNFRQESKSSQQPER